MQNRSEDLKVLHTNAIVFTSNAPDWQSAKCYKAYVTPLRERLDLGSFDL
jgi:hypothetical protein